MVKSWAMGAIRVFVISPACFFAGVTMDILFGDADRKYDYPSTTPDPLHHD